MNIDNIPEDSDMPENKDKPVDPKHSDDFKPDPIKDKDYIETNKLLDDILKRLDAVPEMTAAELDRRIENCAMYMASKGGIQKIDMEEVHKLFTEFKIRIKKGCFDIYWLESQVSRIWGALPFKYTKVEQDLVDSYNMPSYVGPRFSK